MVDPVIALGLGLLLGWVLLDAGLGKLRDVALTAAHIDDYRLLPDGAGAWLARPLGVFEVCLAVLLLLPVARIPALYVAAILLGGYGLAITVNLLRGRRDIDCGCGGVGQSQRLSVALPLRNALLVAAALLSAASPGVPSHWSGWLFALFCAVVVGLLYASVNGLLANHQQLERLR
jgi:uncharacterized membrane protein YphA (DoxX/SURF4 family)